VTDNIVQEGNALTIDRPGALQVTRNGHARAAAAARRPRGVGRVYQPEYKDKKTGERRTVATWWIQYSHHGKVHREPSHSTARPDAVRLLKKRLGEMGRGKLVGPKEEKLTFEDLVVDIVRDYALHERCSANTLGGAILPDGRLDVGTSAAGSGTSMTSSAVIARWTSPPTGYGRTRTRARRPAPRPRR
jgi:hypothetical protein